MGSLLNLSPLEVKVQGQSGSLLGYSGIFSHILGYPLTSSKTGTATSTALQTTATTDSLPSGIALGDRRIE